MRIGKDIRQKSQDACNFGSLKSVRAERVTSVKVRVPRGVREHGLGNFLK